MEIVTIPTFLLVIASMQLIISLIALIIEIIKNFRKKD